MNKNITYRELIANINKLNKEHPKLDILDQPVRMTDPQYIDCYYNISNLYLEDNGHFSLGSSD